MMAMVVMAFSFNACSGKSDLQKKLADFEKAVQKGDVEQMEATFKAFETCQEAAFMDMLSQYAEMKKSGMDEKDIEAKMEEQAKKLFSEEDENLLKDLKKQAREKGADI